MNVTSATQSFSSFDRPRGAQDPASNAHGALPTESFVRSSGSNPMAEMAKLRDLAAGRNAYGDNAGVGSAVERGGDLSPAEVPLICCYAVE